ACIGGSLGGRSSRSRRAGADRWQLACDDFGAGRATDPAPTVGAHRVRAFTTAPVGTSRELAGTGGRPAPGGLTSPAGGPAAVAGTRSENRPRSRSDGTTRPDRKSVV